MGAVTGRQRRIGTALVVAQFALISLCVLPVGPRLPVGPARPVAVALLALAAVTGVLALRGLGSSTRVHPVPADAAELREHGIYARIRHPMYAAVLLACSGAALLSGRLLAMVATLLLVGLLVAKARFEDRLLTERFGDQHARYVARVPALVPRLRRAR